MLLYECIFLELMEVIMSKVLILVIGIGVGFVFDVQVLVLYDMFGVIICKLVKFVKNFMVEGDGSISGVIEVYVNVVKVGIFLGLEYGFE